MTLYVFFIKQILNFYFHNVALSLNINNSILAEAVLEAWKRFFVYLN